MSLKQLRKDLRALADPEDAKHLQRFFKTGPGEYGEGDVFLGIRVPVLRKLAQWHNDLPQKDTWTLLKSKYHEERLLALFLLINWYKRGTPREQGAIYRGYLKHTRYINNWDLVDLSAYHIVGAYLEDKDKTPLTRLARSPDLWERRIAMLSTFYYIRKGSFTEPLRLAALLLRDEQDLVHKAVGWMLREVGNRDLAKEEAFLRRHYQRMPRTMLRYAIEKFPERKRLRYLKGRIWRRDDR